MRENDFSEKVKKAALVRANFKCERCWREDGLEFHHIISVSEGGDHESENCIVLCHECHRATPSDTFLLKHLFLRFASVKEMIQYYKVESEQQALEKWRAETDYTGKSFNSYNHGTLVKKKMEEKAKKGVYLGFAHPYGYNYKNGMLSVNEKEATVVKKIFQDYINGKTLDAIANDLNRKNIKTKNEKTWAKQTVALILKNPLYCGIVDWNGIINKGQHEAIIDKNMFLEAQKVFRTRSGKPYMTSNI